MPLGEGFGVGQHHEPPRVESVSNSPRWSFRLFSHSASSAAHAVQKCQLNAELMRVMQVLSPGELRQ